MRLQVAASCLAAIAVSACGTRQAMPPAPIQIAPAAERTFLTPTPARSVTTFDTGAPVTRYWATIPQDEVRRMLDLPIESAFIEEIDSGGRATLLGSGAGLRKGRYRATYYYYRTRSDPCSTTPAHGSVFTGIGIRITAEIETTRSGVNVGDIMGLALAADRGFARGQLTIQAFGISSSTTSIAPYLNAGSSGLTVDGLRKAVESFGVIKAIADTPSVHLTPHHLYIEARDPEGCFVAQSSAPAPVAAS